MLVSLPCMLSLFFSVGGLIYPKHAGVLRYKSNVIGKYGHFYVILGQKSIKMRMSLQEEKDDLIGKWTQHKFRQFYPK